MKTILTILLFLTSAAQAGVPTWMPPMVSTTPYGTGYLSGVLKIYPSTTSAAAAPAIMLDGINKQLTVRDGASVSTISATGFYGSGSNLTGIIQSTATGTYPHSITGNAGTVTNGVYTSGSYANPAWITSLATAKIDLSTVTTALAGKETADATIVKEADLTANDFNVAAGVVSLDYTNGQAAGSGAKGFLTSTDWSTFNGKQAAGNYITALTGNVTASGPGSVAATIVSVPQSAVNLSTVTTALSGKQDTGNYITSLTGAATASGPGAAAVTIVSVPQTAVNLSTVTTALAGKLSNTATVPATLVDLSTVTTALAGKQATGNYITSLTGAVTASGPGAAAATIVSVPQSAVNLSTVTTALSGKLDTNGSAASLTSFPTLNQNTTGNAATATALAADPADCSGVNFARGVAASGAAACAQPSDVTGNSATATKLATARNINGVAFDGSANINIATTSYLADGVSLALTGATFSAKSSSVTLQGNTFNGASQLVKLDALSKLPAVDGSQLTNLPSTSGGAVLASTQTFTGANTFSSSVTIGAQPSGVWPMSRVHVSSTAGNYTWTVPAGVGMFKVTCIGGGGAGGTNAAGGGGGGGGTAIKYVYGVAVSSQIAYTVGAAGAAGGNGGTSTFGSYCSASGGSAGGNGQYTNGGPYGVGLTGDLLMSGNGGATGGDIAAVGVQSGSGGASVFGGGGTGVNNGTGTAGGDYGGGGGGGTGAASGGKGAVIIEY